MAIVGTFATAWFPENQIGFAMSLKSMGLCLWCVFAFLVPSQLVPPPPTSQTGLKGCVGEAKNDSLTNSSTTKWFDVVQRSYLSSRVY